MMRLCAAALLVGLGIACATRDASAPRTTQVVTFPEGAIVHYRGHAVGRSPAKIILPQDTAGRLTERAEVSAVPNTAQGALYAQSRILDPAKETDRIPDRIMIDMTLRGTNAPAPLRTAENESSASAPKPVDRGKPTQAVGLDRWNPGIY